MPTTLPASGSGWLGLGLGEPELADGEAAGLLAGLPASWLDTLADGAGPSGPSWPALVLQPSTATAQNAVAPATASFLLTCTCPTLVRQAGARCHGRPAGCSADPGLAVLPELFTEFRSGNGARLT